MLLFKKNNPLIKYISEKKKKGAKIGFVPTMGALHKGHLSLILASKQENDITVTSIFVNPTQFNDPSDLEKYPRTEDQDIQLLSEAGNDILFMPEVQEIYPEHSAPSKKIDLNGLDHQMEGAFREGHFEGVVQVVTRLLEIVQPHHLYMGQKDFQQFTIIDYVLKKINSEVELRVKPIVREEDGLAMSSRNKRLTAAFRRKAPSIFKTLQMAKVLSKKEAFPQIRLKAMKELEKSGLKPEYFEFVNGQTLQPIQNGAEVDYVVACVAAWAGDVRLIDNIIIEGGNIS